MNGVPILIVDDNPVNLKLARVLLTVSGYEAYTATDANEAMAVLAKVHPGLILMDIQLPGMDGLELTRRLKADPATRDIVIIALTAFAMKRDEERALAAGCDGYIPKPIDTRTLVATLAEYMARAGPDTSGTSERIGAGPDTSATSKRIGAGKRSELAGACCNG